MPVPIAWISRDGILGEGELGPGRKRQRLSRPNDFLFRSSQLGVGIQEGREGSPPQFVSHLPSEPRLPGNLFHVPASWNPVLQHGNCVFLLALSHDRISLTCWRALDRAKRRSRDTWPSPTTRRPQPNPPSLTVLGICCSTKHTKNHAVSPPSAPLVPSRLACIAHRLDDGTFLQNTPDRDGTPSAYPTKHACRDLGLMLRTRDGRRGALSQRRRSCAKCLGRHPRPQLSFRGFLPPVPDPRLPWPSSRLDDRQVPSPSYPANPPAIACSI